MPDLFHVALLSGNAFILSVTCALYARTRYHSNLARTASNLARADRADARRFAERAEAAAPVILPFETSPVFAPEPVRPGAPKLFSPGGPRDADEYVGA